MADRTFTDLVARRSFLTRLGAGVTVAGSALAADVPLAQAQSGADWRPARHPQDDWMDQIPGEHRFVFDTTTPAGFGTALAYANNYLTANQTGYGLKDSDAAVIIIARHFSTGFAYNDAIWAKYGAKFPPPARLNDPKTNQPAAINLFMAGGYPDLPNMGATIPDVLKRGIHFAVCQVATRFIAGAIAGPGGNADAVYNELVSNLVGNGHMVSAGIVAVNRAQEHGYSLATV